MMGFIGKIAFNSLYRFAELIFPSCEKVFAKQSCWNTRQT